MQLRNEYMIDKCDYLVACWNGTKGGTYNAIRYAEKRTKMIDFIDI